jgi:hypothetical protein
VYGPVADLVGEIAVTRPSADAQPLCAPASEFGSSLGTLQQREQETVAAS